jgi:alcohol dehydrogenase class IV
MNTQQSASVHRVPKVYFGAGCLREVTHECSRIGARRVLLVSEDVIRSQPQVVELRESLGCSGIAVFSFTEVVPDPTVGLIEDLLNAHATSQIDLVIGIGGGSAIDVAKVAALGLAGSGPSGHYLEPAESAVALPLLAVPTTAGTGSEVTAVAVVTDTLHRVKKGVVSEQIIPVAVFLEPALTQSLPSPQTAYTGLDALTHAVEAFTSKNANAFTDVYARQAIALIRDHLPTAFAEPSNLKARAAMQQAAFWAGLAFGNAGVTAAHALAYPVGARHHAPHGLVVALLLPAVLRHNRRCAVQTERWEELDDLLGPLGSAPGLTADQAVVSLCQRLRVETGLASIGVEESELRDMAQAACEIDRILRNNPAPLSGDADSIYHIYRDAFEKVPNTLEA